MTDVRFVVLHHRGPAWIPWKTMVEQPGTAEHVAHWAAWFEAGKLAWGGARGSRIPTSTLNTPRAIRV